MSVITHKGGKVYGVEKLLSQLRKRRAKAGLDSYAQVKVGYSAPHAAPVHERLDVYHPRGQAKYLEQPLRTEEKRMGKIITSRLRAGQTLIQAQIAAANHLMKVSLRLVPVDTGELRDSWFIKATGGVGIRMGVE